MLSFPRRREPRDSTPLGPRLRGGDRLGERGAVSANSSPRPLGEGAGMSCVKVVVPLACDDRPAEQREGT